MQRVNPRVGKILTKHENDIGGDGGCVGVSGSITPHGMHTIFHSMKSVLGDAPSIGFLDIGAGIGRPMVQSLLGYDVGAPTGIEIDAIKCEKSKEFIARTLRNLLADTNVPMPSIHHRALEDVGELPPASCIYSFWEGMPPTTKKKLGTLVSHAPSIKCVAVVQKSMRSEDPATLMKTLYQFENLEFVTSFPVSMCGSRQKFVAYIFRTM